MNRTSFYLSIITLIAVIVLYILHFTAKKSVGTVVPEEKIEKTDGQSLQIAFVKADSVLLNYNLSQDLHDEFTKKQEAYNSEFGSKRQSFEKEATAFQEKLQRGGFLTEQRAIQERDRLVGVEQEIIQLDQELSGKLSDLQIANNQRVLDSLINYIEIVNKKKQYDYIFNSGDILVGKDAHNLTLEILTGLNKRYKNQK